MIRRRYRFLVFLLPVAAFSLGCGRPKAPVVTPAGAHNSIHAEQHGAGPPAPAGRDPRHALLVGCTRYANLKTHLNLRGPANDVILMRQVLKERFDFPDGNIVTLADASSIDHLKPTRRNIQREFERLAKSAKKGDQIVILLAGHGSQQPDREPFDEVDGLDEVFLPSDAGPWLEDKEEIANAIVDDELGAWAKAITDKGASLWVIVDACHSGTMLRGDSPETAREIPAEELVPRGALEKARGQAALRFKNAKEGQMPAPWAEQVPGLVAIYAAQPTEPTVERKPYDGSSDQPYGLLTYTLCKTLTAAQSPVTYRELTQRIHADYVRHGRSSPVPLVEGQDMDREVLGLRSWPGRSRILLEKAGDGWKVTSGQLNGLSEKSILAIYLPAGAKAADKPVGHVLVRTSHVTDADVVPCAHAGMEAPKTLLPGGRCEPVYIDYGDLKLSVHVEGTGDEARTLKKHLQNLAGAKGALIATADLNQADWLVQADKGQAILSPTHATLTAAKRPQTAPRFGPYPLDDPGPLKAALERIARARNLLKLTATMPAEAFRGNTANGEKMASLDVELTMLNMRSKDDQEGMPVTWKERGAILAPGASVAFRIHNRSRFAVDVSLLFVDSGFGIQAVFPKAGTTGDNRMRPGQYFRTGPLRVNAKTLGLEHLVLIAVRGDGQPLDFTCLAHPTLELATTRGNAEVNLRSPLGQLLSSALYGQGTTRGLETEEIDNHALRLLSWYVEPTETDPQE